MSIRDRNDAAEVEDRTGRVFAASPSARAGEIRALFVEVLDFDPASGEVSLDAAPSNVALPGSAHRVARLDGVQVLYVALGTPETDRVRKGEATVAAKLIADQLGDDLLLVFTNTSASQLHLIYPGFEGARPSLRRIVVERDLPRRTSVQQVANIFWSHKDKGSIRAALDEAFDVEPVTRAFFAKYKELFEAAEGSVVGFGRDEAEKEKKRRFVQTLFNRLMFVYFLQRKGWLGFQGDKDYLNALRRAYRSTPGKTNFYVSRLRALFFNGLNNPDSRDLTEGLGSLIGDVPFLNGGLFEETELDKVGGVTVPDSVIERVLDDLFDRFNFTVMESTPFDIEVAVDPEMLGKVFEELVTGRHESGSYYTPRPVVSFMCREAIKGYLEGRDTGLSDDDIARFVDEHSVSGIALTVARNVSDALDEVTVVDPACGSGAYLLGMMQELVELQTLLYSDKLKTDAKDLYNLKLHIIQRNLYGVDIDEFAVNIAMLRMWLSLAIDFEGPKPEPLPNLDFKVVRGDSLLGPDPSPDNYGDLFRHRVHGVAAQLADLKAEYMDTTTGKDALREEIERVQGELRAALADTPASAEAVDWRVQFAEVFDRGGFDVVLANPPYVVTKDSQLRAMYNEGVYGRINLYGLFIQRSLQIMSKGSQLFFINPKTLLTDRYFTNLRKVIKQKSELRGVVLIADRHNTFERVLQECIILHLSRKAQPVALYRVNTRAISIPADLNNSKDMVSVPSDRVLLSEAYDESFYVGASEFEYRVFERMNSSGVKLSDLGFKAETGKIQFDKYHEYAQPTNTNDACRLIWAENIQRYVRRASRKRKDKEWLSKGIAALVPPNITDIGIVTQRVSANEQPRRIIATLIHPETVAATNVYSENHTNFIPLASDSPYAFLLAALNSSFVEFVFRRLNSNTQVSSGELNRLPFPPLPEESALNEIETLVSELLRLGGVDCRPDTIAQVMTYEHRLDILIGSLYGFSPSEVEQVQQSLPSYEAVYGLARSSLRSSSSDEVNRVVSRGQAIYEEKIRNKVEKSERGKFVVIDVFSEDYEIDTNHAAATRRLTARHPGVITYTIRIGYPTTYNMGIRSSARTQ